MERIFGKSSENVGKGSGIVGNLRQGFGNRRESSAMQEEKLREGWVGEGKKERGRGGWGKDKKSVEGGVGDDVIEKNEKIKNKKKNKKMKKMKKLKIKIKLKKIKKLKN